jgi:hypothetical protein
LDYAVGALGGQVGEDLDAGAGFLQKKGKDARGQRENDS